MAATEPKTVTVNCAYCGEPVLTFSHIIADELARGDWFCGRAECVAGRRAKAEEQVA